MSTRIFVGNLPIDIKEREIEDLFSKYGKIRDIDIKSPSRPPAFAFVTYDDPRDADDAIYGRDGYQFDGMRLRVEVSKVDRSRFGGRDDDRGGGVGGFVRKTTGGRRTDYGVLVSNLPRGCSWQDLKDFMRKAGDVVFTDVDRNGEGIVEFSNRDDMERAVDKLDDVEFKSRDDSSYIRVKFVHKQSSSGSSGRGRSRSVSRSRSRSRDRRGGGGDSRSRSKSLSRSRSRDRVSGSGAVVADKGRNSKDRSVSRSRSPAVNREDEGDDDKVISHSNGRDNGDDRED